MIVLAELTPLNPVTGLRETLRASSANDSKVTGLNDLIWQPAISVPPILGIRLFKGDFDGTIAPSGGSITIQIDRYMRTNPAARGFIWQGARIKLWAGNLGQAWPWTQVFEGVVDGDSFTAQGNKVSLNVKSDISPFEKDALTLKYLGTGGIEGGEGLKGQVKPFLLGRCSNVEPVLIDAVNNVYQFSGYGPIQAVNTLYERGSAFPVSSGNHATYAALVAASVPNGGWATCINSGLIRLGAPQYGVITGDVDGDSFGGTWRRKTGEIVQRIASNAGISGALIDTASWNALDTALSSLPNQGRIGYFMDSQRSVLDVAAALAAPCNAQTGVSLLGKLFACRMVIGAGSLVLDAQQRQLPRVTSSEESGVSPPFSYMQFGYDKAWRVHTSDEIAFVAITDGSPGPAGLSNATVFAFKRSATPPTNPSATATYTFATGVLTGLNNGWTQAVPASDGNPLYVIAATVSANTPTDTIAAGEWSSAVIQSQDGGNGTNGLSTASVYLYQRNDTGIAPAVPSASLTYTFTTALLTGGLLAGWTQSVPPSSGGRFIFITTATALSAGATDTITTGEWATVQILAQDGLNGPAGLNNATVYAYQRSASSPATPSTTATYTFATGALTGLNNGWTQGVPTSDGNPLYVIAGTASSTGSTDTIAGGEWSSPVIQAQDGSGGTGSNGLSTASIFLYQRNDTGTAPAVPTDTLTYTFATGVLSGGSLAGWSRSVPAASGGKYVFITTATALSASATDTIGTSEWATVQILAQSGENGTPGDNGTFAHIAYATAPDGSTGFSTTDGAGKTYIGTYTDTTLADSTNPAVYTWSLIKGGDGAPGVSPVAAVASPANKQFTADSGGTVKAGQLPFNVAVTGTKAGATISGTVSIIGTPVGCTATAITNGFSIDTVFADAGFVEWRFTASDGQIVENKMSFSRQRDPASGGAILVNFTSDTWWGSGSYAASGPSTVLPASSTGKLRISGYASFYTAAASGNATITAKLQYRAVGSGTWIDSGFSTTGISIKLTGIPGEPDENTPGDVSPNGLLTGLTANGSYEIQMVGTRSGATANNSSGYVSMMQEA